MRVSIGSDEAGYVLKSTIIHYLESHGHTVLDLGPYNQKEVLYPDYAIAVANSISKGETERGILICGTGIGMSISANKVPGIRAAVCHDAYSAERSRKSNDAQILCFGARIVGEALAIKLLEIWLESDFIGGGSTQKVEKIKFYDEQYRHC